MINIVEMMTLHTLLSIRDGFGMLIFSEFTPAAKVAYQPCLRDIWGFVSTSATATMEQVPQDTRGVHRVHPQGVLAIVDVCFDRVVCDHA